MNTAQHGFLQKESYFASMTIFLKTVMTALLDGKSPIVICFDMTKALDNASYNKPLMNVSRTLC